jgi:hypothetical protein
LPPSIRRLEIRSQRGRHRHRLHGLHGTQVLRAELHQVFHRRQRGPEHRFRLRGFHARAHILAPRDQPELLQLLQHRPHGVAAGLELLAQLEFRRQQGADRKAPGSDAVEKLPGDVCRSRFAHGWLFRHIRASAG